jgi:hypothetical protein
MNKTAFAKKHRLPIQLWGAIAIIFVLIGAALTNLYLLSIGVMIALSFGIFVLYLIWNDFNNTEQI